MATSIDSVTENELFRNYATLVLALKYTQDALKTVVVGGITDIYKKVERKIKSVCNDNCSNKRESEWCPTCKMWWEELKTLRRTPSVASDSVRTKCTFNKMDTSFEDSIKQIASIYMFESKAKIFSLDDLLNVLSVLQNCSYFPVGELNKLHFVTELRKVRNEYFAHNNKCELQEDELQTCLDHLINILKFESHQNYRECRDALEILTILKRKEARLECKALTKLLVDFENESRKQRHSGVIIKKALDFLSCTSPMPLSPTNRFSCSSLGCIIVLLVPCIAVVLKYADLLQIFRIQNVNSTLNQSDIHSAAKDNVPFIILLIGKTGTGKSTTGNAILGNATFKTGMSASSVTTTTEVGMATRFGKEVVVVDTPGLHDTERSHEEILSEISKCYAMTSPGFHAIILVTKIDRFTTDDEDTVEFFVERFGDTIYRYLIIIFTGTDRLAIENKTLDDFLKTYKEDSRLKKLLNSINHDRYMGFGLYLPERNNQDEQVKNLLSVIDSMSKNGKFFYTNEMYENSERIYQKRLENVKKREREKYEQEIREMLAKHQLDLEKQQKLFEDLMNNKIKELEKSFREQTRKETYSDKSWFLQSIKKILFQFLPSKQGPLIE